LPSRSTSIERLLLVDATGLPFERQAVPLGWRIASTPVLNLLTDWVLPPELLSGVLVQGPTSPDGGAGGDGGDDVKVVRA
jgi:hypothetical protein